MPKFKIPVTYEMYGTVDVEADTLADAVKKANDDIDELPLPDDPSYVEASYQIQDEDFGIEGSLIENLNKEI